MRYYILCLLTLMVWVASAQTPSSDKNWYLERGMSDEFSKTKIDENKWSSHVSWGTCEDKGTKTTYKYADSFQSPDLFSINNNGILTLKAKKENCNCKHWNNGGYKSYNAYYTEGALISKKRYGYGYFEIRCKLPQAYKYKGINPSFWLYGQVASDSLSWNEIDIYEFNGYRDSLNCNVHYMDKTMVPEGLSRDDASNSCKWSLRKGVTKYDFSVDFSNNEFHTFACEWTPYYINFYCDNTLIKRTESEYCGKLQPMIMYVTMGIENDKFGDGENNVSGNTNWPYSYQIDYIRYYTMKMDCKTVVNKSNFDFAKFDYAVKKSITLKNSTVPQNGKYTLRATDFIELQGEFTVPLGSELALIPTPEF